MNLVKFGSSCYLEEDGQYLRLTYPQYRVLADFDAGRVEEEEMEERLKHYQHLAEMIVCPICGTGRLPREYIQMLKKLDKDGNMHDHTIHSLSQ